MGIISRIQQAIFRGSYALAQKASAVGPMLRVMGLPTPVWTPRQYDKIAKASYEMNVVGYRAVSLLARSMARVPMCLYQGDEEIEDQNHPLLKLMAKPNPMESGAQMRERLFSFYMLSGNAYLEGVVGASPDEVEVAKAAGKMLAPTELYAHRPDRIKIVPSKIGTVQQYIYQCNGSETIWDMDPVTMEGPILHVKTFHPTNDWHGLSPAEAAAISTDVHNESSDWCKALLQHGAAPSGAFVYRPAGVVGAVLPKALKDQLKDDIEERMSGSQNAGRPMIVDGGLEWEPMGLSPKDMDWMQGRFNSAREIASAYGCPPQLLGIPGDNTYSNYQEARLAFFEETVLPLLEIFVDGFNAWLAPGFGDDLRFKIDEDRVPALEPRRKDKWDKVAGVDFLTINEKRESVGYDKLPDELCDQILVESNKIFLDDLGAKAEAERNATMGLDANGDPLPPKLGPDGQPLPGQSKPGAADAPPGKPEDPIVKIDPKKDPTGKMRAIELPGKGVRYDIVRGEDGRVVGMRRRGIKS